MCTRTLNKDKLKKIVFFVGFIALLGGCKSYRLAEPSLKPLSANKIVSNFKKKPPIVFNNIRGKVAVSFMDGQKNDKLTLAFRMKKDSIIWLSAPFGIAKIILTPSKLSFYNKLQGNYFEKNYLEIKELLGTEISYELLQKIILAETVFPLKAKYFTASTDSLARYNLKLKNTLFSDEQISYVLDKQFYITQVTYQNSQFYMNAKYSTDYKNILPQHIILELKTVKGYHYTLELDFSGIEIQESLGFPYKIPEGYKKINKL